MAAFRRSRSWCWRPRSAAGSAGSPRRPAPGESTLINIFIRRQSRPRAGRVARTVGPNWIITSTGSLGASDRQPLRAQIHADWQPIELKIDATARAIADLARHVVRHDHRDQRNHAERRDHREDRPGHRANDRDPQQFLRRLRGAAARLALRPAGGELPIYVAPQAEIKIRQGGHRGALGPDARGDRPDRLHGARCRTRRRDGRRHRSTIAGGSPTRHPAAPRSSVARRIIASVASRTQTVREPHRLRRQDSGIGFSLAGTMTTPAAQGRLRHPAVVLVAGSGPIDRDAIVAGIPIFAQLAGQLAERDFVVLRYDKRGIGQSGGRIETVTLQDYADDAVAAVKWLAKRRRMSTSSASRRRHSEGGAVAMLAAARKKDRGVSVDGGHGHASGAS